MKPISVTKLRRELFHVMDEIQKGEIYEIIRNGEAVARITPTVVPNWRTKLRCEPKLLSDPETVFAPLADEWKEYV